MHAISKRVWRKEGDDANTKERGDRRSTAQHKGTEEQKNDGRANKVFFIAGERKYIITWPRWHDGTMPIQTPIRELQ